MGERGDRQGRGLKAGRILSRGLVPCRKCGKPHNERVVYWTMQREPYQTTWEQDGHAYDEMDCRTYIEKLHRLIKTLKRRIACKAP